MNADAERYLTEVPGDRKVLVRQLHTLVYSLYPRVNIDMLGTDTVGALFPVTREEDKFFI